ncbi:hypothetical protein BM74_32935 [Bacillus thuringiensis]|uniref:Uncharacterized protein n=1 Tax=Bacillus thuringiensis TaxID=1428 RepID=A0A437SAX4_BACTU|nr:hypothetical protein BM74_32935 [Bacillus thuringiensis]
MSSLDSLLTQAPTQAMLEAALFYIEQNSLICLKIVSQAPYDSCESKEVSFLLYESCWIFQALIQNLTFYHPDRIRQIAQTNHLTLPSRTLHRIKKVQHLLQKLRKRLRAFHFLDSNQTCSMLLQRLLQHEMFHTTVAKSFHNRKVSPPWLNSILSTRRTDGDHYSTR